MIEAEGNIISMIEASFNTFMIEPGVKEGNDLVRRILDYGISKYRIAKDLNVSDTQVTRWALGHASPNRRNFRILKRYKEYVLKYYKQPKFNPRAA